MIYPDLSPTVQLYSRRERRLRYLTELLALPVLMVAILQFIYLDIDTDFGRRPFTVFDAWLHRWN